MLNENALPLTGDAYNRRFLERPDGEVNAEPSNELDLPLETIIVGTTTPQNEELSTSNDDTYLVQDMQSDQKGNLITRFFKRHKTKLAVGAAATSATVTLAVNPMEETMSQVVEAAPWVASGVAASEVAFCVGGLMMLSAIGDKIKNPFKIKQHIPELADKANGSALFKSGFWINTAGAVGDFVVISAGVGVHMPPESWGVLSLTLLDLGVTIAVRKAIRGGIKRNVSSEQLLPVKLQDAV